jgi:FkbM family methyltransferase
MNITTFITLASDPGAWRALATWPKFSATSYLMLTALVRQGVRCDTVIDVGANQGQFAIAAAQSFPKATIYSFEADPDVGGQLAKNVGGISRITPFALALGDTDGEITLRRNRHSHSSSILPLATGHTEAFPEATEFETVSVPMKTLDSLFADRKIQSPALLKLDVQGYERPVLLGGEKTLSRIDYALIETSFKPMYEGEALFMEIVGMMARFGFRFLRPVGWLNDPRTGEIVQADALFGRAS